MQLYNQDLKEFTGKVVKKIEIVKNYTGYECVVVVFDDGTSIEIQADHDADVFVTMV